MGSASPTSRRTLRGEGRPFGYGLYDAERDALGKVRETEPFAEPGCDSVAAVTGFIVDDQEIRTEATLSEMTGCLRVLEKQRKADRELSERRRVI